MVQGAWQSQRHLLAVTRSLGDGSRRSPRGRHGTPHIVPRFCYVVGLGFGRTWLVRHGTLRLAGRNTGDLDEDRGADAGVTLDAQAATQHFDALAHPCQA